MLHLGHRSLYHKEQGPWLLGPVAILVSLWLCYWLCSTGLHDAVDTALVSTDVATAESFQVSAPMPKSAVLSDKIQMSSTAVHNVITGDL